MSDKKNSEIENIKKIIKKLSDEDYKIVKYFINKQQLKLIDVIEDNKDVFNKKEPFKHCEYCYDKGYIIEYNNIKVDCGCTN